VPFLANRLSAFFINAHPKKINPTITADFFNTYGRAFPSIGKEKRSWYKFNPAIAMNTNPGIFCIIMSLPPIGLNLPPRLNRILNSFDWQGPNRKPMDRYPYGQFAQASVRSSKAGFLVTI
jgi:hypothetical protein